jgi:ribonucleoside-diphosphate reductase alpha chain
MEELTPNGLEVLTKRYLLKDSDGNPIETVDEMFKRVATHISIDSKEDAAVFENIMKHLLFLPNTPTFTGAGTRLGQLAACFVLPIEDDLGKNSDDGIFKTLQTAALIQQSGGGVGCSWSRLREKGAVVSSSYCKSSGPIPFIRAYSASFNAISQGGRKGANMAVLDISHPDILDFIRCKQNEGDISNFNLSVAVTDEFMRAAKTPCGTQKLISPHSKQLITEINAKSMLDCILTHALYNGEPGLLFIDEINRKNPCKHLYTIESTNPCVTGDTLVETTEGNKRVDELIGKEFTARVMEYEYTSTERGFFPTAYKPVYMLYTNEGLTLCLTIDHPVLTQKEMFVKAGDLREGDLLALNDGSFATFKKLVIKPNKELVYDCTIPGSHCYSANNIIVHNCGEQALGPGESCNLGSINLARHIVLNDETLFGHINWELLQTTIHQAVKFLDNVVSVNNLPHERLKQASLKTRRIGLGFMGLADLLYAIGVRYGSALGVDVASQIAEFIQYHAILTSVMLAIEKGPFPAIKGSCFDPENFTWKAPMRPEEYIMNLHRPQLNWSGLIHTIKTNGIRNAALTTVAPTGTISTVAGIEGYGIEPVFSLSHTRYITDQATGERKPLVYNSALYERALRLLKTTTLPPSVADIFVTAQELKPEEHIKMQAAVQRYFCNSISKTINLPPTADLAVAKEAAFLAWELKCRGITLYKTGSRDTEVLVSSKK